MTTTPENDSVSPPRWPRGLAIASFALAAALCIHYALTRLPFGAQLAFGLVDRARDLAVLLAMIAGAWGAGTFLLRRLNASIEPGAYHATIAIGLGFLWHMSAVILLAIAQGLRAWSLLIVLVLPLVMTWLERDTLRATLNTIRSASVRPGFLVWAVALPMAALYVVVALGPPVWTDPLTYHLAIPKEYIQHGGVPTDHGNFFNNFPTAFSMLYLMLMDLGSDLVPKLLHLLFIPMTAVVAYHHFRRASSSWVATWSVLLFAGQWTIFHGVQRENVDFQFAFYGLTAFLLLVESLDSEDRAWPVICGLLLGATVAGKVHGVACVAGMAAVLIVGLRQKRVSWRQCAIFAGAAFLAYVPTLLRNLIYSFDPFLFWITDPFGFHWGAAALEVARWHGLADVRPVFMTRPSVITFLLSPIFVYTDGFFPTTTFDGFVDPLYLIGIPLCILLLRHNPFVRRVLTYLFGFYCGWLVTTPLTRYAIPVMPLVCFLTLASFDRLYELGVTGMRRAVAILVAALCLFNVIDFAAESSFLVGFSVPAFLDLTPRRAFVAQTRAIDTFIAGESIRALEAREGRTTRATRRGVFMILASESYYLDTRYYNDPFYVNLGLLETVVRGGGDPIRWLHDQGYEYVLFEQARIPWLFGKRHHNPFLNPYPAGLGVLAERLDFFRGTIEPRLQLLQREPRVTLYRIPATPAATSRPPA